MVWSVLGDQHGPVHFVDWESVHGTKVPFPSTRKADRLLRWPRAHRRERIGNAQAQYTEELARAAEIVGLHYMLWNAKYFRASDGHGRGRTCSAGLSGEDVP